MKKKLKELSKNKTLVGIICICSAIGLTVVNVSLKGGGSESDTKVFISTEEISAGDKIIESMLKEIKIKGDIPENIITSKEEIVDKYAKVSITVNDFMTNEKLSNEAIYGSAYLENLEDDDRAISVSINSNAKGLSGKLESGDIVSLILSEESESGEKNTYIPEELKFVEVVSVADSSGLDVNSSENAKKIGSTITLLVREEQALILANAEENKDIHFELVYRGNDERKQKLLSEQLDSLKTIYPENFTETTTQATIVKEPTTEATTKEPVETPAEESVDQVTEQGHTEQTE